MKTHRGLWFVLGVVGGAAAGAVGTVVFVASGFYDVAASTPHTQPVFSFLKTVMRRSVRQHAAGIEAPHGFDAPAQLLRGAACFEAHCVDCHGAPGRAPAAFGLGLQPLPPPLVDAARHWSAGELYWITRGGIKMTAMPAWEYRLDEDQLWALVALMQQLPQMAPGDWRAWRERAAPLACERAETAVVQLPDARRGQRALEQHGCASCHAIDGITGDASPVGPPLSGFARRERLPGGGPNTHEQRVRWLLDPSALHPGTAMPDLGLAEQDARDIAAFLATQR